MPPSIRPPPDPAREQGSLVTRFGTLTGVGTAGAMACTLPAALRIARAIGTDSAVHLWFALGAAALLPMVVALVVLGRAREGSRAFLGPGAGPFAFGISTWLLLLVLGLSAFGSALRATTHHHALAGVTFALGALALAVGGAVVCARIVGVLKTVSAGVRRVVTLALSALIGLAVVWLAVASAHASSRDPASSVEVGTVVDLLAFVLAAAFAARQALVVRRILGLVGPPVAVVVLAVGVPALRSEPMRGVILDRAPVFATAARLVAPGP